MQLLPVAVRSESARGAVNRDNTHDMSLGESGLQGDEHDNDETGEHVWSVITQQFPTSGQTSPGNAVSFETLNVCMNDGVFGLNLISHRSAPLAAGIVQIMCSGESDLSP
jgi:hypothetical protein